MKQLCQLSEKERKAVLEEDKKAKYQCKKCKRVASKKKMLCKAKEIK